MKNRFRFRFQFCLCSIRTAFVSGFQFHPRKLFSFEYGLFQCSLRFGFISMISSSSDGQLIGAIASEVVDLGIISSSVKPKTQKLVFTASTFDTQD